MYNEKDYSGRISAWAWAAAILLPIVGIIIGIVRAARGDIGPALAIWVTSFISWMITVAVLVA